MMKIAAIAGAVILLMVARAALTWIAPSPATPAFNRKAYAPAVQGPWMVSPLQGPVLAEGEVFIMNSPPKLCPLVPGAMVVNGMAEMAMLVSDLNRLAAARRLH